MSDCRSHAFRLSCVAGLILFGTVHLSAGSNLDFVRETCGCIPSILVTGKPGTGKTTACTAVGELYGCDRALNPLFMDDVSPSALNSLGHQVVGVPKMYVTFVSIMNLFTFFTADFTDWMTLTKTS